MLFYVGTFSMATLALLVAVLMRWPKRGDKPEQDPESTRRES